MPQANSMRERRTRIYEYHLRNQQPKRRVRQDIPGFIGWLLPYMLYKRIKARKSAAAEPLIENQYDSIYNACAQGRALLAQ